MKKLIMLSSILLGVIFLAGCGQQVSKTQPTALAPVAQTQNQSIINAPTEQQIESSLHTYYGEMRKGKDIVDSTFKAVIKKVDGAQAYGEELETIVGAESSDGGWWLAVRENNEWKIVGVWKGLDIQCTDLIAKYNFKTTFLTEIGITCHY